VPAQARPVQGDRRAEEGSPSSALFFEIVELFPAFKNALFVSCFL
jgi:hypothetical protein